jgi:hypothetical protein
MVPFTPPAALALDEPLIASSMNEPIETSELTYTVCSKIADMMLANFFADFFFKVTSSVS